MTRPFADLLALRIADPRRADLTEQRMRMIFPSVARPAPGWIVALQPLPGTTAAIEDGYAFVEGRDRVLTIPAALDDPATIGRVPGDLTYVRFRPDGSALAVRSAGGPVPLAVSESPAGIAISTRLDWLARYAIPDPHLDPLPLAMMVSGSPYLPGRRLFVRGVRSVALGGFAAIGDAAIRLGTWWTPPPTPRRIPSPRVIRRRDEQFRSIVLDGLARDLDETGENLLTFSGGADSSMLAILAASTGRSLSALTLLTGSPAERDRETRVIDAVKERVSFKHHHWVDGNAEQLALTRGPLPVAFPILHPALLVLPRFVSDDPPATLFGGEFADEFWGVFAVSDWLAATTLPGLVRATARGLPKDWKDPLRWARARTRPPWSPRASLPEYVREPLRREHREWLRTRMASAPKRWRSLSLRLDMFELVAAMNWEACARMGIRRVFPLVSRELIELTFASHPAEFMGPGFKARQRRVFRDLVPPTILDRPKAPFSILEAAFIPDLDPAKIEALMDPGAATPTAALGAAAFIESLERAAQAGTCLVDV